MRFFTVNLIKIFKIHFFCPRLFVPFTSVKLLSLDNKMQKKSFCFVLSSLIRTFVAGNESWKQ